jgi:two-component system, sensor histidine kinase LadS
VRSLPGTWLFGVISSVLASIGVSKEPAIETLALSKAAHNATEIAVRSGALDSQFETFKYREVRARKGAVWLRLTPSADFMPAGTAALTVSKGRHWQLQLFANRGDRGHSLTPALEVPEFRGVHRMVYVLPDGLKAGQTLYARIEARGRGAEELRFSPSILDEELARAAEHARMIALAFGALMALAIAAFMIWFVLSDRLFVLYGTLISLQAIYVAYLSGQGFDWPVLAAAGPLTSHAWNVPVALSGAVACLFVREIADLRRFSPRAYAVFGWLAVAFVVLAFTNLATLAGLGAQVAALGNVLFLGAAVFTLAMAFLAWRRGSRAAGWFLIAWAQLEAFTIATAARLLFTDGDDAELLLYYGLPLSMVAAAILIALGVADRMREQRVALTEAERRAQTDPLTGVLNRRSLIERLDAACTRARARGLPIAVLFIDLDHFKQINDSFGHAAGDACLRAVVEPIQAELRQSDVVGRFGGEEFVVILSSADESAAHPIAERICRRVAETSVAGFGDAIHLTCSIGVAASDTLGVWGEQLITQADSAVYAAKRSGRNRVQIAEALAA